MQASLTQADEKSECARGTRPSCFLLPAPRSRGAGGQHLGATREGGTHNSIA